ncbi:ATP-binding protein [Deferribacteraceae bacterium V6Fe1]|nr:ATP-binding protein [Deferribacteraceae bacterium V6Fe1]
MDRTMIEEKTKIGKDVIESLTLAMYDDPKFIYREYIQNSADQIDIALEKGLIKDKNDCKIEITIDKDERKITIMDNGTGVPSDKILFVLKNIAQGVKDRKKHKGFRGIGRLGGLAYCDKLIFETSYYGEEIKSTLIWDANKLKKIINNRDKIEDAAYVIDEVTSLETEPAIKDERYFKVVLENVSNENLLDKDEVYEYLSMVAPVPYKKGFIFTSKIYDKAKEYNFTIDEYNIYINTEQIFKAYTVAIYEGEKHNKKRIDDIFDIEFFDIKDKDEQVLCWGWYSISSFLKQIPSVNIARGIRLRKGNIQIGDDRQLGRLFKESRGTFYFFGEVHAMSPNLIPNARRDYFTENNVLTLFEKNLKNKFKHLHEIYHVSSQIRNEKKRIEEIANLVKEYADKSKKGFTKPEEQEEYEDKIQKVKVKAEFAAKKIEKIKTKAKSDNVKTKLINKLTEGIDDNLSIEEEILPKNNEKPKLLTDNLPQYNRSERKLISKILSIIDNVLPKDLSETVKQKIIEELKK